MENFTFINPVKIIFGKDTIREIRNEIPSGSKVLVIYGGGSIRSNGVYDQVSKALAGFEWCEFSGIEANPHCETCLKAVSLIKEESVDYLLAVGGGSVIDATKFIASAACFDGDDPWDIIGKQAKIDKALPFGVVLTLSATGSEMNALAVISKAETKDKRSFGSPVVYPKFSVLDPETTYSLPMTQISNGVIDAFVHVIEQYLTYPVNALIQDKFAESILSVLTTEGPKVLENPYAYDIRANLMWASTWALNGWIGCGVPTDWATHRIGHELTALCGLDHARTLAIVLPGIMTVRKDQKAEKILQLGERVFGICGHTTREEGIQAVINAVEEFFERMQAKTHLSDYGLGRDTIDAVSDRLAERGWKLGERQNVTPDIVKEILTLRL